MLIEIADWQSAEARQAHMEEAAVAGTYAPLAETLAAPFRATVIRPLPSVACARSIFANTVAEKRSCLYQPNLRPYANGSEHPKGDRIEKEAAYATGTRLSAMIASQR
jgi:hypothetical protein